jgi:hypothetical protein
MDRRRFLGMCAGAIAGGAASSALAQTASECFAAPDACAPDAAYADALRQTLQGADLGSIVWLQNGNWGGEISQRDLAAWQQLFENALELKGVGPRPQGLSVRVLEGGTTLALTPAAAPGRPGIVRGAKASIELHQTGPRVISH